MKNNDGRQEYGIFLDNTQLRANVSESKNMLRSIGDTAVADSARIDNAYKKVAGTVAALGGTVALGALSKQLYDFSNAFDKSMKEVATISDTVSENMSGFKRQILELGTKVPIAADAAGKALYQIVSAGYDGAAGMSLLEVSAKSAIAGMTDTTTAADAITTLLNAYKKSASEAESISDQLFMTAKLGKTTFGELGQSISQAAPIAASFGIETEQVLAAVATLTKSGTPTAQAMTQIRAAIIGASKVLGDGAFQTMTFQDGLAKIADMAGGSESKLRALIPEIEGMNGVLGLTGLNAKMAASDLEALGVATGETTKAFAKMNDSADNQLTILKNNMLKKFSEIGDGILDIVGGIAKFLNGDGLFSDTALNDFVAAMGALIAIYGTYKATLIVTNALQSLNNVVLRQAIVEKKLAAMAGIQLSSAEAIAAAKTKLLTIAQQGLVKSIKAAGAAMMANPYALIAAAIAGIGFVLYKVLSQQSEFEKAQERLSEANKEVTQAFASEIRQLNALERRLAETKKGSQEYKAIKDEIVKNYGKYYDGLDAEIEKVGSLSTAYETLVEKIRLSIGARKFESFFQAEQDNLDKVIGEKLDKAYETLVEKYGKDKGNKLYSQLFDKIMRGTELPRETWKELNAATFTEWGFENSPVGVAQRSVSSLLFDVDKAKRASDKAISDFKQVYQITEEQVTDIIIGNGTSTTNQESSITTTLQEVIKNIKNTEATLADMRKKAQKGLVSDEDVAKQEEALAKLKDSYKTKTGKGYDEKPTKKDKPKDYTEQLAKNARDRVRFEVDFEHAVRQARINAMDEGIEKILAQNQLNFDKEQQQVERQKTDMLADIQNWERNIWEAQNPKWEKEGKKFAPKTTQLSSEQLTGFDAMVAAASKKMELANKDALDAMLNDYMTYEQRRDKVIEDYEKKRKTMQNADGSLKSGVKQGNVDELNRSETDSLSAIDEEFAQREDTYEAWMNQIANYALNQLEQALVEAKRKLKELEESGTTDSKKLSVARAKVNTAQKKVSKAKADNEASPGKRTIKEWEDLYSTLREVEGEFKNIGDAIGGVAGETINTVGTILTSTLKMVDGIITFATTSITAVQGATTAGVAAIKTVEAASVILAVIAAAMQIAMTIISLFNNDNKYQEEIENLQGRIDQLQWELDNADALRLQNNTFKTLQKVREVYAEATREVLKLHAANNQYSNALYQMFGRVIYQNEIMERSVERLAKAYANISYTADKALGEEKFSGAKDQLENIAEQQLLIQQQIDAENSKKKTDNGQIKEWEQKIQELGAEANQIINEIVEEIIGGSSSDIAEELGNAFIDAFRDGEDAAEAWGAKVNDIVADVMKRMLISKFLEKPLGEIFDKYKSKWYKDGQFAGIDAIMESMGGFANDLNAVGSEFQTIWENLPEDVKNMFAPTEETREASQKGIASASQESVDELNGRMTAVQGHTYLLSENSKILVANSNRVLQHLAGIESNTESLSQLENIKTDINGLKKVMDDIALKGIKLK